VVALVALLLIATATISVGALVTSGLFGSHAGVLSGPLAGSGEAQVQALEADDGIQVTAGFQVTQPRDPFRPLVTPDSPVAGQPGIGGEPGSGDYNPDITTVKLNEIRDVGGVLRASVTVNGTTYDVGVGDTFAGSFKVISLTEEEMVYSFGDAVRTLRVGQQILK
jgi:type IV pilus biogenesis protein PilP